jgi:hypothetical protein
MMFFEPIEMHLQADLLSALLHATVSLEAGAGAGAGVGADVVELSENRLCEL